MRSPITVSLILSTLMLVSIIPYDVPTVLEDIDEVMFANSEPQMLVKAGTSSGHVNSTNIEAVPGGWVISGDTRNNLQFGPHQLQATSPNNGGNDADSYIAKVDDSGVWQWAVMPDASAGLVFLTTMTVSMTGEIYIGGLIWGQVGFGPTILSEYNNAGDGFVAKLDPMGNWMWATSFTTDNNSGGTWIRGLSVNMAGDLIASGDQSGDSSVGGIALNTSDREFLLIGMDSMSGGVNWASATGGLGTEIAYDVGVDMAGDIWQVGVTGGTFTGGGKTHQAGGQQDTVLVKWSPNGQVLDVIGLTSNSGSLSIPDDLIITASGDILISGVFTGTLDAGNQNTVTDQGNGDAFIVKIANNGATSWITSAGSSGNLEWASSIAEDQNGDFAVGGVFSGTSSFGSHYLSSNGAQDAFIAQIDNLGNWKWVENLGGSSDDLFGDVAINMTGNYSATGSFQSTINKGTQSITSSGGLDLFVWVLDPVNNADRDNDGVNDQSDNCPDDNNPLQIDSDLDGPGDECDYDDDNDGITDNAGDDCPRGGAWNWTSDSTTDFDNDGCKDSSEDTDDDNDGVSDGADDCLTSYNPPREWWVSTIENDLDGDGCRDSDEDLDDDGDGYDDAADDCNKIAGTSNLGSYDGCVDTDSDGYADLEDTCPTMYGNSTLGTTLACPDMDGDGWADTEDDMPNDPTQWLDSDDDGYGDNPVGNNPDACPSIAGTSIIDRVGCPDPDADGYSSSDSSWSVEDGADAFPAESTQWSDWDEDGFGDNWGNSTWVERNENWPGEFYLFAKEQDTCPTLPGNSWQDDILGCPDSDGDGWADYMDAFPGDAENYRDIDGDGIADGNDDCMTVNGSSTEDVLGCPDMDGDGWADPFEGSDAFPLDPTEWLDSDSDFIGDNSDSCPNEEGDSLLGGLIGCLDSDGDGWADTIDAFPEDYADYLDTDGDGFGDSVDDCLDVAGASTEDRTGCPDEDKDGISDLNDVIDPMIIYGGVGAGVLVVILLVVFLIMRRKGSSDETKSWAEPAMPDMGAQPVQPAMPDMYAQPAQPAYSQPVQPAQPAMPDMYAQPAQPAYSQPVQPVQPAMPDMTAQPEGREVYTQPQPVMMPVAPAAPAVPTVNDVGTMRSDGNEWLEFPDASGAWYMRDAVSRQWERKI